MNIIVKPLNDLTVHISHLVKGRLWLQVIIGLVAGACLGMVLNPSTGLVSEELSSSIGNWLDLPGSIFMRLVHMIMIPLIFSSIISGIVSNVSGNLRTFGLGLLGYFVFTTVVAISFGVVVSLLLNPGKYIVKSGGFLSSGTSSVEEGNADEMFSNIPESISNLIPANPLQSILTGEMLSIVIFTLIIGVAITQLQKSSVSPMIRFVEAIQKICMVVVGWAMRLVPYAVFGLMAALLSRTGVEVFFALGYYVIVVLVGLLLLLIFYLVIVALIGRMNPFKFLSSIKEPQLLAFSTASSAAVMPLSMKTADEKLGVSSNISDFVIPIGATVNMDGTALFQCVTVLFMAQAYGIELSVKVEVIIIVLSNTQKTVGMLFVVLQILLEMAV
ncbi:MAG: dicarboxylate/amino acid:cation symporter [Flavobacteriales bacterium]|nr:dicarboxylate/amino acid:cation symporter [Flavobacteriales bacterium]